MMGRTEDKLVGTAKDVMSHNLDTVEAGVDSAIDGTKEAVHELRNEAQQIVDQTLNRVKGVWEQQRPRIEGYMDSHPWLVLAGLVFLGFLFSRAQHARRQTGI